MRRRGKKLLALLLALAMVGASAGSVFAAADPGKVIKSDWPVFRGNSTNNGVTSAKTPTRAEDAMLYWASRNGSGWSSAPGSPILVDGYLYFNTGKEMIKMDAVSGDIAARGSMTDASDFSICPPAYADGKIYVALKNGVVQAFDAKTMKSLWVYQDPLFGQPNSPIAYDNGRLYVGFWNSETREANFVCLTTTDPNKSKTNEAKKAKWTCAVKGGFYWAGAYACRNFVLVGTDDGETGWESESARLLCFDPKTGKLLDSVEKLKGDIRSSVSYDKATDRYYFASKGGSFYSVKVSDKGKISDLKTLDLGGMCTSTPAVHNGRAYVGVCGKDQFGKNSGHCIAVIDLSTWKIAYRALTMGYPQTSGLISTGSGDGSVYVYFFENYTPGKLRVLRDKPGQSKVERISSVLDEGESSSYSDCLFTPKGAQAQYAICSPIADEYGTLYFKNDSGYVMAVGSRIESIEITGAPSQTTYDIGDPVNLKGIKAAAHLSNGLTRDISDYVECAESEITEGQVDLTITYPYVRYNDRGEADPLFTTVDIKVNSKEVSEANNAAKKAIKASRVEGVKIKAAKKKAAISWKKVSGASGYQVSRSAKKTGTFTTVKTTSSLKYTNTSLTSKKTYYYKVRAYKTINGVRYYGRWSSVKTAKVK